MLVERSVCARARRGDGKFLRFGASRVELEVFVRDAKWNMYAERWEKAKSELERANELAVFLRDKTKIDEILTLLKKCQSEEKVEL